LLSLFHSQFQVLPFFLGGFSGVISKTVTAPFERITIVLQVQDLKQKEMRYKGTEHG
jgi:hypothetical protein